MVSLPIVAPISLDFVLCIRASGSVYVNSSRSLYRRGCGQGHNLLRFVQLSHHLTLRHSLAYL
jgi:hypothetical protein